MQRQAANLMRRLTATVLAVGLSLCCCQAHVLFAGASHLDAGSASVATAVDSCCESPANAPDRERPAPVGCQTCCIKGTGLKDPTTLAQPAVELLLTLTLPTVVVTPAAPAPPVLVARVDPTRLRVVPRTLVDLRCALIV